ncbi:MAG: hypothetical protein A2268_16470 [Candidatus Raymondbacteria bacterium RifOxyA12_full_50_37]|uniref:Polymerase beta nucleotidyltransferase domain-containing protein n=1 Tax=Candidatus Raymondbacteria bacterium RIFOXYD12_FULL_49_13 TaxID=1817890 RepID=A0A1F7F4J7_UNCRA|nr:MAG: hypothetical protein A2268_16470 [Candidatus Raymondbacteria bacterium RifOxyA12_full_50_37]OGJ86207.1 MAG: hypothetical protein A2248_16060 [Candidatus Raymondbacteria bacterium RIFOXYA2_FULL_49_16]OGJ95745.1 MAG: hypothetical protein A2453_11380 [Candidatus Raymondbacteria bacterium RIFOXYC2_FULL_50_21]OGJ98023.1 MAG: hypothetical protein A2487_20610 [Candidatus Raymondbacteria bacterium RifOxyC12_full_50_8]OGJ98341.1 MAG: hypothetical protein A2350_01525 [Candidatus Raymondbacteria b
MVTKKQIDTCVEVAKKYGIRKLMLFGSANDDMNHARDIDLLCYGLSEIDVLRMSGEIENRTGILVDAIPADQETPFVRMNVVRGKVLYDAARAA